MNEGHQQNDDQSWQCAKCGGLLQAGKVIVTYLGNDFPVELLKCQKCGLVLVTEDLAMGKMAEVEKLMEDK